MHVDDNHSPGPSGCSFPPDNTQPGPSRHLFPPDDSQPGSNRYSFPPDKSKPRPHRLNSDLPDYSPTPPPPSWDYQCESKHFVRDVSNYV